MPHGGPQQSASALDADFARVVAETMQALATPSRVRILGRLSSAACSVNELAAAVGMEPSAVSHQLRLLRHLGLVVGRRDGRRVVYDLHDDHVGELIAQTLIFALSGSVALLADLIHNFGDALTALPLSIAFWLQSERAERGAGLFVVAAIFISACVAGVEAVIPPLHPIPPTPPWGNGPPGGGRP